MRKPSGDSAPEAAALVLSPEAPYPAVGGGALRSASLIEYLGRRSAVDLIVFREAGAPDPRAPLPPGLVRRVDVLDLPLHSRAAAARAVRNLARFARGVPPLNDRFAGFGAQLRRLLAGRGYGLVLVEHFWCAPYIDELEAVSRNVVLDLHNIESTLLARSAAAETGLTAALLARFARAAAALERRWLPRFSRMLAASENDAARLRALAPSASVGVYPNALPSRPVPRVEKQEAIVFSGNLEYHPNRSAVKFFARRVWPALRERRPGLRWRIVGKNPDAVRGLVGGDGRVELTGPVEDAVAELARARVAVVPVLAGSGTRVKILEAWAAALSVVSTAVGAEGLEAHDGEHLLLADTAEEMRVAVEALLDSPRRCAELGAAARRLFEERFTWEAAWRRLDEAGLWPPVVK